MCRLALKVDTPASKAQAGAANLTMNDADPSGDAAAVARLPLWALKRYGPIVAVDGADGIVMDTEGADLLQVAEIRLSWRSGTSRFRSRRQIGVVRVVMDQFTSSYCCGASAPRGPRKPKRSCIFHGSRSDLGAEADCPVLSDLC